MTTIKCRKCWKTSKETVLAITSSVGAKKKNKRTNKRKSQSQTTQVTNPPKKQPKVQLKPPGSPRRDGAPLKRTRTPPNPKQKSKYKVWSTVYDV